MREAFAPRTWPLRARRALQRGRLGYLLVAGGLGYLAWRLSVAILVATRIERTPGMRWLLFGLSAFLVVLCYLVFRNLFLLWLERRRAVVGSRLKLRLARLFFVVAVIPVVFVSVFTVILIDTGIDAVHQPRIERALDASMHYLREGRDELVREFARWTSGLFRARPAPFALADPAAEAPGRRWTPRAAGRLAAGEGPPGTGLVRDLVTAVDRPQAFFTFESGGKSWLGYRSRAADGSLEYAAAELPAPFAQDASVVGAALAEYRSIRLLREPLRVALVYLLTLIVITLTLLVLLVAMRLARNITGPVEALAEGTRRIAAGDLSYRVAGSGDDELSLLVERFNSMGDELVQSRQRLYHAERIAAWHEVARRLAHEVKNPLTPIRLAAERVLRQATARPEALPDIVRRAIPAVIAEVENIQRLVDEFASFARLPGKHVERVAVDAFASGIAAGLSSAHERVRVEYRGLPAELFCWLDPAQMRRAIGNLAQNAINAIDPARGDGRVELAVERRGHELRFTVADNGRGIPDEIRTRVFDPYFTDTAGGTGLGLAITEKIVFDHDGKIWFDSRPGQGTAFHIEIPIREERP